MGSSRDASSETSPPESFITAIRPDPRDPARQVVYIDGRRAASLPLDVVRDRLRLTAGMPLSPEVESAVRTATERDVALRTALNMLNRRAYAEMEMVDRLVFRKGISRLIAEEVAAHLSSIGAVNDLEYARAIIRTLISSRPAGAALMRQRLRAKRLRPAVIEQVVAEFADLDDQPEALERLIERRLASMQSLAPEVQRRRLHGLLVRRGFSSGRAAALIQRHVRTNADDDASGGGRYETDGFDD